MISIIAAIGKNRELGNNNQLIWKIPDDLRRFKNLTSGHPIIMGRKTHESIGRVLPGRTNIVISRDSSRVLDGAIHAENLDQALSISQTQSGAEEVFVIGGGRVYADAIDIADRLYLTVIDETAPADTYFPSYTQYGSEIDREDHPDAQPPFTYHTFEKE